MHPAELDHDGWESKRSLLRKCALEGVHLDLCFAPRDEHTAVGQPPGSSPVMLCGKREIKSHVPNVASPCTWMVSRGSSSQQLSKSPAKAQAATALHQQPSQRGSPDSSGDNSQQTPQESQAQALHDQVKKPRLDNRWTPQSSTEEHPRPTPRRLHFPTDLDLQEQGSKRATAALAMKPSHLAAPAPNCSSSRATDTQTRAQANADENAGQTSHESDPDGHNFNVDYF